MVVYEAVFKMHGTSEGECVSRVARRTDLQLSKRTRDGEHLEAGAGPSRGPASWRVDLLARHRLALSGAISKGWMWMWKVVG